MILCKFKAISASLISTATLLLYLKSGLANAKIDFANQALTNGEQTIEGITGGSIDSQGCGFIANTPNYEMNLETRIDYLRFTVETTGGQPTLLVVGPNAGDSFCVLGDEISGLKPEISGVWESGYYKIYVGDRTNEQHKFVLGISSNN